MMTHARNCHSLTIRLTALLTAMLTLTLLLSGCGEPPDGDSYDTSDFAIGDEGPAGGLIFFVDTDDVHDFNFLEAAPEDVKRDEGHPIYSWAAGFSDAFFMQVVDSTVGTGEANTRRIVNELEETDQSGRAAQVADDHSVGGYSDWFLPSKDELQLMYDNLHTEGLGDFHDDVYWSSTEHDINYAHGLNFNNGFWNEWLKTYRERVRPIRAF